MIGTLLAQTEETCDAVGNMRTLLSATIDLAHSGGEHLDYLCIPRLSALFSVDGGAPLLGNTTEKCDTERYMYPAVRKCRSVTFRLYASRLPMESAFSELQTHRVSAAP